MSRTIQELDLMIAKQNELLGQQSSDLNTSGYQKAGRVVGKVGSKFRETLKGVSLGIEYGRDSYDLEMKASAPRIAKMQEKKITLRKERQVRNNDLLIDKLTTPAKE